MWPMGPKFNGFKSKSVRSALLNLESLASPEMENNFMKKIN